MALYFVQQGDGLLLIRARNGRRAKEIVGDPRAEIHRVHDTGDEGVIDAQGNVMTGAPAPENDVDEPEGREVEITSLCDKGVRRYRNLDTGQERTEPRND